MREHSTGDVLKVRAIAGTYVVVLAWDFVAGQETRREGLLGFAIQREQLDTDGSVLERYWMTGIKRFKDKDRGLAPGTPVSTAEHPFQSFQWADYTAETRKRYRYRVVPAYGIVKRIELDDTASVAVEI